MAGKDWVYDDHSGEHRLIVQRNHQTYRIRAVLDESPGNPFTDGDNEWPIIVRSPDSFTNIAEYTFGVGSSIRPDVWMFEDAELVHNQHHIASVLGSRVCDLLECYSARTEDIPKHSWDAQELRYVFDLAIGDASRSSLLHIISQLCAIAGIKAYRTTVNGYSQGDCAEVLVVATKAALEKFGTDFEHFRMQARADLEIRNHITDHDAWVERRATELMLKPTAQLYGWWAFGDVYGYIVERRAVLDCTDDDDDGTAEDWEEIDSCWGYYGPDFAESGLEEAALECLPAEVMVDA